MLTEYCNISLNAFFFVTFQKNCYLNALKIDGTVTQLVKSLPHDPGLIQKSAAVCVEYARSPVTSLPPGAVVSNDMQLIGSLTTLVCGSILGGGVIG